MYSNIWTRLIGALTGVPKCGNLRRVRILGIAKLQGFARRHANARKRIAAWERAVDSASWKNLVELQATFSGADLVDDKIIFNIGGNNYRLKAIVDFAKQTVLVTDVQTHAEYDREG
jgi:mRNA interferase HigB